jgi:hypothetical protein
LVFCRFRAFTEIRICGSSKATQPHPCARRRQSGLAVLRFGVKPHPCIIGLWDCRPCPSHSSPRTRAQLLANGEARAAGQAIDPLPVVRLFTPDAHVTWLLAALDPADGDTAYGLIDLGIGMPALGTVKLSDLAGIVGPRKQPVMRDRYFRPRARCRNTRLAEENGAIPD